MTTAAAAVAVEEEAGKDGRSHSSTGNDDEHPPQHEQQRVDVDSQPMIQAKLPAYLSHAFAELYEEDGLVVLGRGLGTLSLLASFVRFYADPSPDGHAALVREETGSGGRNSSSASDPLTPPLVFVLGLKDSERKALISTLVDWGTPPELLPTEVTNESGQGKDRETMYRRGGVFLITSRILIVDLLTQGECAEILAK